MDNNKERNLKYKATHKKEISAYRKSIKNLPKTRFLKYSYNARKRGYIFDLSEEQFCALINMECHYDGSSGFIGVDRKDNLIGYTIENCVPCCSICNRMKGTIPYDEFIETCSKISKMRATEMEDKTNNICSKTI